VTDGLGDDGFAQRRASDQAFLGLELGAGGQASFVLTGPLARHDGRLYGGTAVAVALALAEQATERPALWTTVQFVSGASVVGDRIDCAVEVLASGRRASQVRVTARLGDQELFCAVGATATPKESALAGSFEAFPDVPGPQDAEPFRFPMPPKLRNPEGDLERLLEIRIARRPGEKVEPGQLRYWVRVQGQRATPAVLGYAADMVPMSVVHALGRMGGGTSLDNTLRLGAPADTEWILLDLHPHSARGGYGTGTAHLWAPDGTLLATASQTAALIIVD
jgi:acyl-CoA thioesterase